MSGCKHGVAGPCTRCYAEAELAALRAEVARMTGILNDASHEAEEAGRPEGERVDKSMAALRAQLAEVTEQRDALRADADLLDWCERQWRDGMHIETCAANEGLTGLHQAAAVFVGNARHYAGTVRAAINAARGAE